MQRPPEIAPVLEEPGNVPERGPSMLFQADLSSMSNSMHQMNSSSASKKKKKKRRIQQEEPQQIIESFVPRESEENENEFDYSKVSVHDFKL